MWKFKNLPMQSKKREASKKLSALSYSGLISSAEKLVIHSLACLLSPVKISDIEKGKRIVSIMTESEPVKINVEYCGSCGHRKQFLEMAEMIRKSIPEAGITGSEGRQASFEIQINDQLVYSKLQTMAFPDYQTVVDVAKEVSEGQPIRSIKKEQPIDCSIS